MDSENLSQSGDKDDCCINASKKNASGNPPCCQPQVNVRSPSMDFDGVSVDARRESVAVRQATLRIPQCCKTSSHNPYISDTAVSTTSSTNKQFNRISRDERSKKDTISGSNLDSVRSSRNLQDNLIKLAARYKVKHSSTAVKPTPVIPTFATLHSLSVKSDTVSESGHPKNSNDVSQVNSIKPNDPLNKDISFPKKKKEKKAAPRTLTLQESIKNFNEKRKSEKYSDRAFSEIQDNIQSFTDNENIVTSSTPYKESSYFINNSSKDDLNYDTDNLDYDKIESVLDANKNDKTYIESNFSLDRDTSDVKAASIPTQIKREETNNQPQSITVIKANKGETSKDFAESLMGLAKSSHSTQAPKNNTMLTIINTMKKSSPTKILDCCIVNEEVLAPIEEVSTVKEKSYGYAEGKGRKNKTPIWGKGGSKYSNRYQNSQRPYCIPTTCSHLNKQLEKAAWKNCCDQSNCPLNDPSTSTYKFLQKIKLCCNKRACHLASRICDIYEPLIKQADIEVSDLDAIGDSQYHYLFTDAETTYEEPTVVLQRHAMIEEETEEEEPEVEPSNTNSIAKPVVKEKKSEDKSYLEEMKRVSEYENLPSVEVNSAQAPADKRESILIDPAEEEQRGRDRRASTVSWSVPTVDDGDDADQSDAESTASQEKIVAEAMAAASKFRQTPQPVKQTSIFGEIVRHGVEKDTPDTNVSFTGSQEMFFKSQLESGNMKDNKYRMKMGCCSRLLRKFKGNKKNKKNTIDSYARDSEDEDSGWQFSAESKKKRSNIGVPIQEKRQQINSMLNNM